MLIGASVSTKGKARQIMQIVSRRLSRRIAAGNKAAAFHLMHASLELVPRDTQALADSARISTDGNEHDFSARVFVGYGGRDIPPRLLFSVSDNKFVTRVPSDYALYQHEAVELNHPNGGQAGFLSQPSRTDLPEMRAEFRSAVMKKEGT